MQDYALYNSAMLLSPCGSKGQSRLFSWNTDHLLLSDVRRVVVVLSSVTPVSALLATINCRVGAVGQVIGANWSHILLLP
jgi:hypothetical protein